jgi:hypothetical protein
MAFPKKRNVWAKPLRFAVVRKTEWNPLLLARDLQFLASEDFKDF